MELLCSGRDEQCFRQAHGRARAEGPRRPPRPQRQQALHRGSRERAVGFTSGGTVAGSRPVRRAGREHDRARRPAPAAEHPVRRAAGQGAQAAELRCGQATSCSQVAHHLARRGVERPARCGWIHAPPSVVPGPSGLQDATWSAHGTGRPRSRRKASASADSPARAAASIKVRSSRSRCAWLPPKRWAPLRTARSSRTASS